MTRRAVVASLPPLLLLALAAPAPAADPADAAARARDASAKAFASGDARAEDVALWIRRAAEAAGDDGDYVTRIAAFAGEVEAKAAAGEASPADVTVVAAYREEAEARAAGEPGRDALLAAVRAGYAVVREQFADGVALVDDLGAWSDWIRRVEEAGGDAAAARRAHEERMAELAADMEARLAAGARTERDVSAAQALHARARLLRAGDAAARSRAGEALVDAVDPVYEYLERAAFLGAVDVETFHRWSDLKRQGEAPTEGAAAADRGHLERMRELLGTMRELQGELGVSPAAVPAAEYFVARAEARLG